MHVQLFFMLSSIQTFRASFGSFVPDNSNLESFKDVVSTCNKCLFWWDFFFNIFGLHHGCDDAAFCRNTLMQDSSQFWRKLKIIKVVTFNINPEFTEVTLNSFLFVMVIFCTNPARKFGMIDITHEVSLFITQRFCEWNLMIGNCSSLLYSWARLCSLRLTWRLPFSTYTIKLQFSNQPSPLVCNCMHLQ